MSDILRMVRVDKIDEHCDQYNVHFINIDYYHIDKYDDNNLNVDFNLKCTCAGSRTFVRSRNL